MRRISSKLGVIFAIASLILGGTAAKASDEEIFSEAKIALEKYKDCARSLELLDSMSAGTHSDPIWIYYVALAQQCVGHDNEALILFEKYNQLIPDQPSILEAIADLKYRTKTLWRKEFCPTVGKLSADWPSHFSSFRKDRTSSFISHEDGALPLWTSKIALVRPTYKNIVKDELLLALSDDGKRRAINFYFYRGTASDFANDLFSGIENELKGCFGGDYKIEVFDRIDADGKVIRAQPLKSEMPVIYGILRHYPKFSSIVLRLDRLGILEKRGMF